MKAHYFKIDQFEVPFRVQVDELPYFYNKYHYHPQNQLTYIDKGTGTYLIGNKIGRFTEGDMFVLGSHLPHVFMSDDKYFTDLHLGVRSVNVFFTPDFFSDKILSIEELSAFKDFISLTKSGLQFNSFGKEEILADLPQKEGFSKVVCFLEIIESLIVSKNKALEIDVLYKMEEPNPKMEKLYLFTFENFKSKISLSEVADLAGYSENAFCKFFKKNTGQTYVNFLNEVRISHALSLLQDPLKSITDVAFESGFQNMSNFNRQFYKKTNINPKSYQLKLHSL